MDGVHVQTMELDELRWQEWVEKGKMLDRARKRRWRSICGVVAALLALLLLASGIYRWILSR